MITYSACYSSIIDLKVRRVGFIKRFQRHGPFENSGSERSRAFPQLVLAIAESDPIRQDVHGHQVQQDDGLREIINKTTSQSSSLFHFCFRQASEKTQALNRLNSRV